LTGGIGSGKSAAAERFAELGAAVIDADAIAHELTRPGGAAMPLIEQAFGAAALAADGSLDRAAMRRMVFADPLHRERLEAILHPMIRASSDDRCAAAWAAGAPYAMMVIPLLVESGLKQQGRFDRIVVVDCPEALQIARVMMRSGLSEAEVKAIMAVQASRAARIGVADDVIKNDGGLDALQRQVEALHVKYCALAEKIRKNG
jgi:dephospho-CoA kinase